MYNTMGIAVPQFDGVLNERIRMLINNKKVDTARDTSQHRQALNTNSKTFCQNMSPASLCDPGGVLRVKQGKV